ncbi:hypothetical protein [Corallococcus sp. EGB]|uniref:hypothetical protein n=1 Tax=Corallococcus sp. EGB TaxID=1521117 RepID=UPI001CBCD52B|nr:hypothetical protein [Corallococcus sp. EGB]
MKKLSKQDPPHNPQPLSPRPSYYCQMKPPGEDSHPVDIAVRQRLPQDAERKRLLELQEQVGAQLGKNLAGFLELESLRSDISLDREEAFFDVGYEYGLAEAQARARRGTVVYSEAGEALARDVRERMVQAQLSFEDTLVALLECLWVAALRERGTFSEDSA